MACTFLSDFELYKKSPWVQLLDNRQECFNREHFDNYPHEVSYTFNSRGFRDAEWPETIDELKEAIWCVGDSFTFAVGAPVHHNWPTILQSKINRRCINISMCGASNEWILRKARRIAEEINPLAIVTHLSYTHRGERDSHTLSDEKRRMHIKYATVDEAMGNVNYVLHSLKALGTPTITSFIPDTGVILDKITGTLDIPPFDILDYARDGKHYDILTATMFADQVAEHLSTLLGAE